MRGVSVSAKGGEKAHNKSEGWGEKRKREKIKRRGGDPRTSFSSGKRKGKFAAGSREGKREYVLHIFHKVGGERGT